MTIATLHHARRVAASLGSLLLALVFVLCGCSQGEETAEVNEKEKGSEGAIGTVGSVAPTIVGGESSTPPVADTNGVVAWQKVYADAINDLTIANADLAPDAVTIPTTPDGTPAPAGVTVYWDDDGLTLPFSEVDRSVSSTSFEIIKTGQAVGAIRGVVQNGADGWSAVDSRVIIDESVMSVDIRNAQVISVDLQGGGVNTIDLTDGSVTTLKIAGTAPTTATIANEAVTNAKIGPDAVTSDKTLNGTILTAELADNAVTTPKIAPDAVTTPKTIVEEPTNLPSETNALDIPDRDATPAPIVQAPPIYENPFRSSTHSPYSTFGIDVDNASYTNVRGYLMRGQQPPPAAVRIEEMINYFDYDYPEPTDHHPFAFDSEVVTCPWNRDHLLVRLALQGRDIHPAQAPPSNLVFLIDVSGSMSDANKLPLLKQSFHLLVEQLRAQDRVAIVVYAGAAGIVLESTSGSEKEKIHQAIDNLEAGGSTAGGAGIRRAYSVALENFMSEGNNRVILATDGDFNVGVSSEEGLVKLIEEKRNDGVFLSVLGFGHGNYQDVKMEQLADNGNGNYYYIDRLEEGGRVLVGEMSGTLYTIAKDVKLQVDFNPEKVRAYRLIGYENRVLAARDFNDDTKDAGELGAGHQVTALYEVVPVGAAVGHTIDTIHVACERLDEELPNLFTAHDLLRARLRYKNPKESVSNLIEHLIQDDRKEIAAASPSTRLAAAIAAWGMSLRGSVYDGDVDLATVGSWLPAEMPDRAEIVGLMEKSGNDVASSE